MLMMIVSAEDTSPMAGFYANVTSGNAPLTVLFSDQSTGSPGSWFWDFGDLGSTSNLSSPTYTYYSAGLYTVNLTVTSVNGTNTTSRKDYINVTRALFPPNPRFTANATYGVAPLYVHFTDLSENTPSQWNWDFGDGTTSIQENPDHIYMNNGLYTVNLTASNSAGNNTISQSGLINATSAIYPPVAGFSVNTTSGSVPLTVLFTDKSTNSPDSWKWDFGDNSTSQLMSPPHTYIETGLFNVSLLVSNSAGSNSTAFNSLINITTAISPPVAAFTSNVTSGTSPLNVRFIDTSIGSPNEWFWEFGDGTNGTERDPVHLYNNAGNFSVGLTAINGGGSNKTILSDYISVINPDTPPSVSFFGNVTSGNIPLAVQFNDSSTGIPTSWLWSFGDGKSSLEQNPVHIYTNVGNFTVNLSASNHAGSGNFSRANYISPSPAGIPPTAGFFANITTGIAPLSVQFTDNSTGEINSWFWEFGDGITSPLKNPVYIYQRTGLFNVSLTVSGPGGSNRTTNPGYINVTGSPLPPVSIFTANVFNGTAPLSVQFTDESTNNPKMWLWLFGDGGSSTEQNPQYNFTNAGLYSVTLSVSNQAGTNSYVARDMINVTSTLVPPVAGFTANITGGYSPLTVKFTDASINSPDSWFWEFGDGQNSSEKNPVHTYMQDGLFSVNLTVINKAGSNSIEQKDYINVMKLPEDYYINATSGVGGEIIPGGYTNAKPGQNLTFNITPDDCFTIKSITVDDISQGVAQNYTFYNISANHTITADFSRKVFKITASAGDNGFISPSGDVFVNCSEDILFTISPQWGYAVSDLLVDGKSAGKSGTYTFPNVESDHTIRAFFKSLPSGSLRVSSNPTGASIFIDGVYRDKTDRFISGIPMGEHELLLVYPFYKDYKRTIRINQGQTTDIKDARLQPESPTETPTVLPSPTTTANNTSGSLTVNTSPQGANLTIDSAYYGLSPHTITGLAGGVHTLSVTYPYYKDYSANITVIEGEKQELPLIILEKR